MFVIHPAAEEVLRFWFGDQAAADEVDQSRQQIWFGKNPAVDRKIRGRRTWLAGYTTRSSGADPAARPVFPEYLPGNGRRICL